MTFPKGPSPAPRLVRPPGCRRLILDYRLDISPPYLEISAGEGEVFSSQAEPAYVFSLAIQNLLFQMNMAAASAAVKGGDDGSKESNN